MRRTSHIPALVAAVALAATCFAQSTPAPPDWQDQPETSVYAGIKQQAAGSQPVDTPSTAQLPAEPEAAATLTAATTTPTPPALPAATTTDSSFIDATVAPATHQEPAAPAAANQRRLAPPRNARTRLTNRAATDGSAARAPLANRMPSVGLPTDTIFTVISALGIVIGGFLIFAWVLRRGAKRGGAMLPTEVVSVLGRVPLTGRQFAELLRVGNKLVLVAPTPGGSEPITEITDPVEVDRLTGLCQQENPHSTTKAFEHVFQQLSRESAPGGFLGEPSSLPTTISAAAEAYRSHRGATARA